MTSKTFLIAPNKRKILFQWQKKLKPRYFRLLKEKSKTQKLFFCVKVQWQQHKAYNHLRILRYKIKYEDRTKRKTYNRQLLHLHHVKFNPTHPTRPHILRHFFRSDLFLDNKNKINLTKVLKLALSTTLQSLHHWNVIHGWSNLNPTTLFFLYWQKCVCSTEYRKLLSTESWSQTVRSDS